jgi:hypothetical protein
MNVFNINSFTEVLLKLQKNEMLFNFNSLKYF